MRNLYTTSKNWLKALVAVVLMGVSSAAMAIPGDLVGTAKTVFETNDLNGTYEVQLPNLVSSGFGDYATLVIEFLDLVDANNEHAGDVVLDYSRSKGALILEVNGATATQSGDYYIHVPESTLDAWGYVQNNAFTVTLRYTAPGNTDPDPEQPGTDPEQPGTDPEQPGTDPEQPGTDPEPEPEPSSTKIATFSFADVASGAPEVGVPVASNDPNVTLTFFSTMPKTVYYNNLALLGQFFIDVADGYIIKKIEFEGFTTSSTSCAYWLDCKSQGDFDSTLDWNKNAVWEATEGLNLASVEFEGTGDYGYKVLSITVTYEEGEAEEPEVNPGVTYTGKITSSLDDVTLKSWEEFEGITLTFEGASVVTVDPEAVIEICDTWAYGSEVYIFWSPSMNETLGTNCQYTIDGNKLTLTGFADGNALAGEIEPYAAKARKAFAPKAVEGETDYQFNMYGYGFYADGVEADDDFDLYFNCEAPAPIEVETIELTDAKVAVATDNSWGFNDQSYTITLTLPVVEGAAYAYCEGIFVDKDGENTGVIFSTGSWMSPGYISLEAGVPTEAVFTDGMLCATDDPDYEGDKRAAGTYTCEATIMFLDAEGEELPVVAHFKGNLTFPELEPTAISNLASEKSARIAFRMDGTRAKASDRGLLIVGGKKVIK